MKFLKKVLLIFLILTLVGCSTSTNHPGALSGYGEVYNNDFEELLDDLLVELIDPKDFTLNLIINDPSLIGITPEPYELTAPNCEDSDSDYALIQEYITKIESFDNKSLTRQQVIDKLAVIDYLDGILDMNRYVDFEIGSGIIGASRSFMGSLPSYMETYTFKNLQDVEYYLHFLQTLPDSIERYIEFEIDRIEKGIGFGREEIEIIIDDYSIIAQATQEDDYFLLRHFISALQSLNLSDNQINDLSSKHEELIKINLNQSYQKIIEAFEDIEAPESKGLFYKPNGKDYYETLLKQSTGRDLSVSKIEKLVEEKMVEALSYLQLLPESKHLSLFEVYSSQTFGDFNDGYSLLSYIEEKYIQDYPLIPSPNYELRSVDPSMADSSSPAFYFTPVIDYTPNQKQVIYINGLFENSLYTTYAHEGIPGHMYQFSYFLTLDTMHPIRNITTSSANAEGWANYTEKEAVKYINGNEFKDFYHAYQSITEAFYITADIGVHWHGWDLQEYTNFLGSMFEGIDSESIKSSYLQIVTNPAVFPTYYLSSIYFEEMRDEAMKKLDDNYSNIDFHKALLDMGSTSFDILDYGLEEYINKK